METWLCACVHVCLCVFFSHASLDIEAQFLTWTQISPSLLACLRIPCLCFLFAGIVDEYHNHPAVLWVLPCPSPGPHTFMASAFYLQSPISRHTKLKLKSRWGSQPTRVFFSCFFVSFQCSYSLKIEEMVGKRDSFIEIMLLRQFLGPYEGTVALVTPLCDKRKHKMSKRILQRSFSSWPILFFWLNISVAQAGL